MNSAHTKDGTVCFLLKSDTVLLILQEYPNGRKVWSGFGGMREKGESLEQCVQREGKEELNFTIDISSLKKQAIIQEAAAFELHVYTATRWEGEPTMVEDTIKDTHWFSKDEIPYNDMWSDNRYWFPKLLEGKLITAKVLKNIYRDDPITIDDVLIEEKAVLTSQI